MRRLSTESQKEPKGILKTQTKYGIPTSPSSQSLNQQTQSKYETVLKQHSDSVLKKERELKQLQQKQNTSLSNNSFHNKSSSSIGSTSKSNIRHQSITSNQRPSAILQSIGLNTSTDGQRRSSRLNDQILEISKGSRGAGQSPLNVNQSHIINNSIHAYVNNQNQISNLSHSPNNHHKNQNVISTGGGGINSAAATMNSIFNQVTLKDLCPEDKFKVGQLMKKLAEEKQQKEILQQKLQQNDNIYNERINYIQKENQSIIENSQILKDRFQQSVKLLQNYRDRSAERSSPGEQIQSGNQYITPSHYQSNSQTDNNLNRYQLQQHGQRKSSNSNRSFEQLTGDQGEQEQARLKQKGSSSQSKQINKSNNDIPVSSFNNIPTKDLGETNEQQAKQKQLKQSTDQSMSSQAIKHEDYEDDEKISRQSRISKQDDKLDEDKKLFENEQEQQYKEKINQDDKQHEQYTSQNSQPQLFNTRQSAINNNLFSKNNNSSKDQKQFQNPAYFMDSLDQEVQEFLAQSIPNNASRGNSDEQKINQGNQLNSNPLFRNSLSPLYSGYRSNYQSAAQGSSKYIQSNSLHYGSIQSPVSQNQATQNSFSKYVNKNGSSDIYNKKQISNSDLFKQKSQLKFSLSPHQKSQQQSVKSYSFQNNGQKIPEFQTTNENNQNLRNIQTFNEHTQPQSERITLRMNTGESEKMFNQWKKQYTNQTSDETVLNSPYKNKPFNQRAKEIEEDDTKTFQEIQNLRSQMQNLVSSLKQISLNKPPINHQKLTSQHKENLLNNQQSHRNTLPKHANSEKNNEQQKQRDQINRRTSRSDENELSNIDNPKNSNKQTSQNFQKNIPQNNRVFETFAALPQSSNKLITRNSQTSQRIDTLENNVTINKNKNHKNKNSDEESSEDDEQIEIAQKFLNLKKQKLLSHLQDMRKDDFLDSSSFELTSKLESQKLGQQYQHKAYDLPLQMFYSDSASNINASTSYYNEKSSKTQNKNTHQLNKDNKHSPLNIYSGEKSFLTPSHHLHNIQKLGNSPQPQTVASNIVVTTSRKSSPQLNLRHPDTVNQDSRYATTSNPETYTRITSRNFTNRANGGGNVSTTGGQLNPQIQSIINTSNTNN